MNKMRPLPEPDINGFTRDQVLEIQRQAFEDGLKATNKDAIRYRWLRDNPRKAYSKARQFTSPYVVDPNKSRLYAVLSLGGNDLDTSIDNDILEDMAQHIYEDMLVNGDPRFSDPEFQFSDEFSNECLAIARKILESDGQ